MFIQINEEDINGNKTSSVTWVHLVAVKVGAALAAADAGEGGDGVSVAVTVADERG